MGKEINIILHKLKSIEKPNVIGRVIFFGLSRDVIIETCNISNPKLLISLGFLG